MKSVHQGRWDMLKRQNILLRRRDCATCSTRSAAIPRIHVARTSVERLLDYVNNTPPDPLRSAACVRQRLELIRKNRALRAH